MEFLFRPRSPGKRQVKVSQDLPLIEAQLLGDGIANGGGSSNTLLSNVGRVGCDLDPNALTSDTDDSDFTADISENGDVNNTDGEDGGFTDGSDESNSSSDDDGPGSESAAFSDTSAERGAYGSDATTRRSHDLSAQSRSYAKSDSTTHKEVSFLPSAILMSDNFRKICGCCLLSADGQDSESNEIVECDGCGISVHESCYGISSCSSLLNDSFASISSANSSSSSNSNIPKEKTVSEIFTSNETTVINSKQVTKKFSAKTKNMKIEKETDFNNDSECSSESELTEPWFCEPCKAGIGPSSPRLVCELCPNSAQAYDAIDDDESTSSNGVLSSEKPMNDHNEESSRRKKRCFVSGGIFKLTDTGRWVHLVCALYTPGVAFVDPSTLSRVTLFELNYASSYMKSSRAPCSLCPDSKLARSGVCIGCDAGMCKINFHPYCALSYGLLSEPPYASDLLPSSTVVNKFSNQSADQYLAHCKMHSVQSSCAGGKDGVVRRKAAFALYVHHAQSRWFNIIRHRFDSINVEKKVRRKRDDFSVLNEVLRNISNSEIETNGDRDKEIDKSNSPAEKRILRKLMKARGKHFEDWKARDTEINYSSKKQIHHPYSQKSIDSGTFNSMFTDTAFTVGTFDSISDKLNNSESMNNTTNRKNSHSTLEISTCIWRPTQKLVRYLSSSPSAIKKLDAVANQVEDTSNHFISRLRLQDEQINSLLESKKRWYVPLGLNTDFVSYFEDRIRRIEDLRQSITDRERIRVEYEHRLTKAKRKVEKFNENGSKYTNLAAEKEALKERMNCLRVALICLAGRSHPSDHSSPSTHVKDKSMVAIKKHTISIFNTLLSTPFSPDKKKKAVVENEEQSKAERETADGEKSRLSLKVKTSNAISRCASCSKYGNPAQQQQVISCDICKESYHVTCISPPLKRVPRRLKSFIWKCSTCTHSASISPDSRREVSKKKPATKRRKKVVSNDSTKLVNDDTDDVGLSVVNSCIQNTENHYNNVNPDCGMGDGNGKRKSSDSSSVQKSYSNPGKKSKQSVDEPKAVESFATHNSEICVNSDIVPSLVIGAESSLSLRNELKNVSLIRKSLPNPTDDKSQSLEASSSSSPNSSSLSNDL